MPVFTPDFFETEDPKYDLHLSAHTIAEETIKELEKFGFVRDQLANNRYCDTTAYHGTFPNWEASNKNWKKAVSILSADKTFNGGLEEEITLPHFRKTFLSKRKMGLKVPFNSAQRLSELIASVFPEKKAVKAPRGRVKACDIHINLDWEGTSLETQTAFENLHIVSFDRPAEKDTFHRIYTLTFEDLTEGIKHFNDITKLIEKYNDVYLSLTGKVKLEITTRTYRKPLEGIVLPIILKERA